MFQSTGGCPAVGIEERYRSLKAALEDLRMTHIALLQRMDALEKEDRELQAKVAVLPKTAVSDSDLQQVSDAVGEHSFGGSKASRRQ